MTKLYKGKMTLPAADFGEPNSLPPISFDIELEKIKSDSLADEYAGLFINYGQTDGVFPYRYQDGYGRELSHRTFETAILENEFLKATFMPGFGGKLWSLFDKKKNRELLFSNSVVRPGNLSIRKAWLSGGVEWNAGIKGHGPYTCAPVHTARTSLEDGTPVLRFYYYERIRQAVVQMDFFLPDDSEVLFARMRLTNPNDEVIPMYWWSNIAVEEKDGDRVVVPADEAFTQFGGNVVKIPSPVYKGIDYTYPMNNVTAIDYFWKTEEKVPGYVYQGDREGYGLFQISTSRLKGRKLFVWGNTRGGKKWMNFLTADDKEGCYDEIQCGLAYTQYESLPMPPKTVWEWVEIYGALQTDAEKLRGEWRTARKETEEKIRQKLAGVDPETVLLETRSMAKKKAEEVLYRGDGWGALELKERGGAGLMCDHLDFGETDSEQEAWDRLLTEGSVGQRSPAEIPPSYCMGENWKRRLEKAIKGKDKKNWYAFYQAGVLALAEKRWSDAEKLLKRSLALEPSVWAEYSLAVLYRKTGAPDREIPRLLSAYECRQQDVFLAKEVFFGLFSAGRYEETKGLYERACPAVRDNARCTLYYAYALAGLGETERAERILIGDEPLVVPDMRECEVSTVDLWNEIRRQKGLPPAEPPEALDFRMFAERDGWINRR